MEMGREERLENIGFDLKAMVNDYCIDGEINIMYYRLNAGDENNFKDWQKKKFNLQFGGSEYFFIYKCEKLEAPTENEQPGYIYYHPTKDELLYVVNITADSYLTAVKELMTLLANKF